MVYKQAISLLYHMTQKTVTHIHKETIIKIFIVVLFAIANT